MKGMVLRETTADPGGSSPRRRFSETVASDSTKHETKTYCQGKDEEKVETDLPDLRVVLGV